MDNGHITQIFHHYIILHMQISFAHVYYDFYLSLTISQVSLVLIMSVVLKDIFMNVRFTKVGSLLRCILHQLLLTQLFSQHFVNYIRIRRKRYFLLKKKYLFSEALLEFHAKNGREKGRGTETIETCSGNCLLAKDSSNFCWKFNLDGDHVALFRVQ